jgi:GDP-D-mannose 3',5'-epimerase
LVDIIEKIAGVSLKRDYDLSAPKGVRGRNSDNTKILDFLNWQPEITLQEGLKKTYDWIEQQVKIS